MKEALAFDHDQPIEFMIIAVKATAYGEKVYQLG